MDDPSTNRATGLAATPSAAGHIDFLDYLRGIAILFVFLYHCLAPGPPAGAFQLAWNGWWRDFNVPLERLLLMPAMLGWAGVAIFFVISGFCIHLSHERSNDRDWGIFFFRRFFRIYPPYLAALLIFALVFPWSRLDFSPALLHTHSQFFYYAVSLAANQSLIHNLSNFIDYNINGAMWSIAVEVQLYLLYPLLISLARLGGWSRVLWITGGIEIALRGFSSLTGIADGWLTLNPLYFWYSWTIGAALAEAWLKGRPLPFTDVPRFLFPLLLLVCFFFRPCFAYCFTLAALSTAVVMARWLVRPEQCPSVAAGRTFHFRHLRSAGLVSYSFYLIHVPLLAVVYHVTHSFVPGLSQAPMFLLCAVLWFAVLLPAWLFHHVLEQPSIALGKMLVSWRKRRSVKDSTRGVAAL